MEPRRARTAGLRRAMAALFQLSYGPLSPNCSLEIEVIRPVDPTPLVVATRGDAKRYRGPVLNARNRNQKAPVELQAVRTDRVDLLLPCTAAG